MPFHAYVAVQARGVISLPAEVRRRLRLDEAGAQVELTERADGVIELRPSLPVPTDQMWFWDERWQLREREVDAHVAADEVTTHADADAFLAHLDALSDDPAA
jgi:AbrB family looped-hinge helix DNA binding protein